MIIPSIKSLFRPRFAYKDGFSIICVYNNRDKLDHFLLKSLEGQSATFEFIGIDNQAGKFASAPQVLNEAAKGAKFDHLMFVHQDVALSSSDWLADVQNTLKQVRRYGAVGVAGAAGSGVHASVSHGVPPQPASKRRLKRPKAVQTLDGCLMIVPKSIFAEQGFDEETCRGWYLYVADYCLDLDRRGLKVYVLPHGIYHEGTGPSSDPSVYESARRALLMKHREHVRKVYMTIGVWET